LCFCSSGTYPVGVGVFPPPGRPANDYFLDTVQSREPVLGRYFCAPPPRPLSCALRVWQPPIFESPHLSLEIPDRRFSVRLPLRVPRLPSLGSVFPINPPPPPTPLARPNSSPVGPLGQLAFSFDPLFVRRFFLPCLDGSLVRVLSPPHPFFPASVCFVPMAI